ncbi:hypothetical protein IAR55_001286 [Kwoniella newhampshirensis]|uniref:Uncharacterized protein n=1 Tax=Kwoniella newhampshirensis TaxID=1651941 RepID=A0AAW0Z5C1_9TREE
MPSLLSKFRHRKTPSTSSANSTSAPPSPTSPSSRQQASPVQSSSPTFANNDPPTPSRTSLSTPTRSKLADSGPPQLPPIGAASGFGVGSGGGPIDRSDEDVVLIDKNPSGYIDYGRDHTGHQVPFVDESHRPDLPTTSSNVNNPPPATINYTSPSSLLAHQAPGTMPSAKPLPPVPEVRSTGGEAPNTSTFPVPPHHSGLTVPGDDDFTPPVPPRSPDRHSVSRPARDQTSPPPMPHVTSVNRAAVFGSGDDRPGIIPSSSRPPRSDEQGLHGRFGHVDSLTQREQDPGSESTSRRTSGRRSVEVPKRATSLNPRAARLPGNGANISDDGSSYSDEDDDERNDYDTFPRQTQSGTDRTQGYDPDLIKPFEGIQLTDRSRAGNLGQGQGFDNDRRARVELLPKIEPDLSPSQYIAAYLARQEVASGFTPVKSLDSAYLPEPHSPALEAERLAMVEKLLTESSRRRAERGSLNPQGRQWFSAVGLENAIGKPDTVDVETQWLEPVIKETIYRKEINEYCIVINREIHKYHIYPKIQPIHDTDPIRLPTLHRIFSPLTGKWHEVEGDAAAIAILGQDTFNNGPKEVREIRRPALPGLEPMTEESGARSGSTTGVSGLTQGAKRVFGGGLTGRILEREYPVGGRETDWRVVRRHGDMSGSRQDVGLAM